MSASPAPGSISSADRAFAALEALRAKRPLVQNITNTVATTISANALLALGASPAMVHAPEELDDFAAIADSLVVNIGTLDEASIASMRQAAAAFHGLGKPWVLDPVGVGATRLRDRTAAELVSLRPAIVRGNASEILSLAGALGIVGGSSAAGATKGVDSTAAASDAVEAARRLAQARSTVVAITGEVDYATDGTTVVAVTGGHALMPLSTALGCALSAVTAGFAAVAEPLEAAVAALAVYGAAGAIAGDRARGPGDLPTELINALHGLDRSALDRWSAIRAVD